MSKERYWFESRGEGRERYTIVGGLLLFFSPSRRFSPHSRSLMVAVYVMKSSMYRVPIFWRFFSAMALSASALFGKLTTASPDGRPSLLR